GLRSLPVDRDLHVFPESRPGQDEARSGEREERERESGKGARRAQRARWGAGGRDRLLDLRGLRRRSRRRVREVLLGREAATPDVEKERCGERKQKDEGRRGAGN